MGKLILLLHGILCASATAVSGYALYVGRSSEKNDDYKAMCDLGPRMSCSSVLTSRQQKIFSYYYIILSLLTDTVGDSVFWATG